MGKEEYIKRICDLLSINPSRRHIQELTRILHDYEKEVRKQVATEHFMSPGRGLPDVI